MLPQTSSRSIQGLHRYLTMLRRHELLSVQLLLQQVTTASAGKTATTSRRHQSSFCSVATSVATTTSDPLHASPGTATAVVEAAAAVARQGFRHQQRAMVNPNLRQRRPLVNGQPVAFHIQDLISPSAAAPSSSIFMATTDEIQSSSDSNDQRSPKRVYESDLVVILDMDECLIHTQWLSDPSMAKVLSYQLQNLKRSNHSVGTTAATTSQVEHFRRQLPTGELIHVNMRPGLLQFLDEITARYETHIFTAARSIYADQVLDQLDPNRTKFAGRWYRQHCTVMSHSPPQLIKNLSTLPFLPNLARTVLIDNYPLSFLSNPSNGILVPSFFDSPTDDALTGVQALLKELESHDDVRPVLTERFRLEEAVQQFLQKTKSSSSSASASVYSVQEKRQQVLSKRSS